MGKKIGISLAVIATLLLSQNLKYGFAYLVFGKDAWNALDAPTAGNLLIYGQIILVLAVTLLLMKGNTLRALQMTQEPIKGIGLGILFSLPMWIGYGFMADWHFNLDLALIHRDIVAAGFREELVYRAFLFGLLFYQARWGFVPAAVLPAIFFGWGHLYQAENFASAIGIFLFTALGSIGFSWFLHVSRNFWLLASLHAFMDLAWDLSGIQTDVTGSLWVNVFRFISLGLMIAYCVKMYRKDPNSSLKGKLWWNGNE